MELARAVGRATMLAERAEAGSRAKSRFLTTMSHEIRTPLNGLIGMTDLALDSAVTEEQRECLGMAKESAVNLLRLLEGVLDFADLDGGKAVRATSVFRLDEMLRNVASSVEPKARQKGLAFDGEVGADVPDVLEGDPVRLRQVLVNLLDNAVKFTESGRIGVSVDVEPDAEGPTCLRFRVHDTGIGIPDQRRESIFEPFEQADGSVTRRHGGAGIGLSIAARLVEELGGRIWVSPGRAAGAEFCFTAAFEPVGDAGRQPSLVLPGMQTG